MRVDVRKLDELMNLVGELALERGALAMFARRLAGEPGAARLGAELEKIHKALDRKLQELQASVIEVRMVPLRQVFDKLARVARRLRLDLGKDARLEVKGADTELDKLIVEELVDPLMHIIRNAFDHGLEAADERRAAGKPIEGTIRLEASQRGNDVVITVADDGVGSNGLSTLTSTLSPSVTFDVGATVNVNAGDGNDTVQVNSLDSLSAMNLNVASLSFNFFSATTSAVTSRTTPKIAVILPFASRSTSPCVSNTRSGLPSQDRVR